MCVPEGAPALTRNPAGRVAPVPRIIHSPPPHLGYPGPIAIPLPTLSVVDRPPLVPGQPALDLRDSRGVGPKAAPCRREGGESLRGTGIDAAALDILDKGLRMLRL